MTRNISLLLILSLIFSIIPFTQAHAESIPDFCIQGTHAKNAKFLICVPDQWNGILLVYAHGYVAYNEPIDIPWDQLVLDDGTSLPEMITTLGFAFATTSYSENGLAVITGLEEVVDLVDVFYDLYPSPQSCIAWWCF